MSRVPAPPHWWLVILMIAFFPVVWFLRRDRNCWDAFVWATRRFRLSEGPRLTGIAYLIAAPLCFPARVWHGLLRPTLIELRRTYIDFPRAAHADDCIQTLAELLRVTIECEHHRIKTHGCDPGWTEALECNQMDQCFFVLLHMLGREASTSEVESLLHTVEILRRREGL
jgi:hypothetical protein